MYLKSLYLHGFKSFADKTKLEFDPGVTAVVGPNGCGKSNVVDAIRWVLGETSAKALRGGEMADVIFNGTDKRKPVGMAEVTMTLANCEEALKVDYNELALTRRVFRDGKSEYRINNTVCRLKDISEMLMDTGIGRTAYSIMEQGKIDMLLSSKPEDRRSVFEEAAGITKFKLQKREALRKLDYTEANLVRVVDIVSEVKRQMGSLQRQAQKARRYQLFLRDLKTLDTHFSHRQFEEFNAEKGELLTSIRALTADEEALRGMVLEKEAEVVEARGALQEIEIKLGDIRQHLQEQTSRIQAATNRIDFNGERTKELETLIAQSKEDVEATRSRLAHQESELQTADETLVSMRQNIARQQAQLDEHAERNLAFQEARKGIDEKLSEVRAEIQKLQSEVASAEAEVGTLRAQVGADRSRVDQLIGDRARLTEEREESGKEEEVLKGELDAERIHLSEREEGLRTAEKACQHTENERVEARDNLRQMHRRFAETKSRRDVLKQLLAEGEGLAEGTQKVLQGLDQPEFYKNNIRGVLASWLQVEDAFIPAIEGVLQHHLQAVVVSDATVAEAIIDALTKDRLGEVALLPEELLGKEDGGQMMTVPDGSVGWALDHVRAKVTVQPLLESLLRDVLIVPDLSAALDLRVGLPGVTFVTLRGETLSPHGVIRGGVGDEEGAGSVLRREQEVRELEALYADLDGDVFNAEQHLSQLDRRFKEEQESLEAARSLVQEARMAISSLEGKYSLVQRELEQSGNRLENVTWELGEVEKRIGAAEERIAEREGAVGSWDQKVAAMHQTRSDLETELESISRKEAESGELLNEIRTALAVERRAEQAIEHQKEPMSNRLGELRDLIERRGSEVKSFQDKITWAAEESEKMRGEIESSEEQKKGYEEALNAEMERRAELTGLISELDEGLSDARRKISKSGEQRSREEVKQEKIDIRLENLTGMVRQRYQLELETFEPDTHSLLAAIAEHRKARERQEKRKATLAAREGEPESEEEENSEAAGNADESVVTENGVNDDVDSDAEDGAGIEIDDGPDWEFVEAVVNELRQRLDSMGPVNLDAIEEFEELEERHNFLQEQHDDLVNSKEELLRVISKINSKTKKMFADTFAEIRDNFQKTFRDLFGPQARANLVLVDEDDPLESGIEIIAKPPGKKLQSISLLSGGERSMTAVALLFSIYMVKPSPFCVLDELDAPLDESNIGRFLEMLDRFIDMSQFVIVTHNKRTMARADVMYGVTMEEFGVSKPVGMKMTSERTTKTNQIAAIE